MKVVVTGAFGYVGRALVRRLGEEHVVLAVGRVPRPDHAEALTEELPRSVERVVHDVRGLTVAGLRGVDAVVHLAGGGAPGSQFHSASALLLENVDTARHIAAIAPRSARLLLASSSFVYGPAERPLREGDPCAPDTLYGQLKRIAEAVWQERGGTALRLAHVYGAGTGPAARRDGVTERLARAAARGETFLLHVDGSQRIDLVHLDDVCDAVARALSAPALPPALNVGGGHSVSIAELAQVFGVRAERCRDLAPHHDASAAGQRLLDVTLARGLLGWAPRVPLDQGARQLIARTGGPA